MLEALAEIVYVMGFVGIMAVGARRMNIKEAQAKRRSERKKQLAQRELDRQCDMVYRMYKLEKQKASRQTITVKGAFAEPLAEMMAKSQSISI